MIVEIKNIDSEALGAVLKGLDEMGLGELTNVFARWAFELEWPEIPEIAPEQLELVEQILNTGCTRYSMRFGDVELTKRDEFSDEDAPDLE